MITSLQNPAVKNIAKLAKSKERKEQQLFVTEGARELSLAIQGGYKVEAVYLCREMFDKTKYPDVLDSIPEEALFPISSGVFAKIAYRENSDGLVALLRPKIHKLRDIQLSKTLFSSC